MSRKVTAAAAAEGLIGPAMNATTSPAARIRLASAAAVEATVVGLRVASRRMDAPRRVIVAERSYDRPSWPRNRRPHLCERFQPGAVKTVVAAPATDQGGRRSVFDQQLRSLNPHPPRPPADRERPVRRSAPPGREGGPEGPAPPVRPARLSSPAAAHGGGPRKR